MDGGVKRTERDVNKGAKPSSSVYPFCERGSSSLISMQLGSCKLYSLLVSLSPSLSEQLLLQNNLYAAL